MVKDQKVPDDEYWHFDEQHKKSHVESKMALKSFYLEDFVLEYSFYECEEL